MIETFYVHLEAKTKTGNWSVNLPFLCSKCGVCCTLEDFLTAGEIQSSPETNQEVYAKFKALTIELGKLFEQDENRYNQYIAHTVCPFQTGNICSIYTIRPKGCRQFPNTPFGMLSKDCKALDHFKKQKMALKKSRIIKETYHFTVDKIKPVLFSKKQYDTCIGKLLKVGITEDEIALFNSLNRQ